jgi:integrase
MKKNKRSLSTRRLCSLWRQYSEFRKPQLAYSTYKRDYGKIQKRLAKLRKEAPEINHAIAVRDWLLENYSSETTRRTLVQLNAAYKWAMQSEMIETNPFDGMTAQFRGPKRSAKAWAAFTAQERDRIIQEFDLSLPWAAPWVKFLFWTGCRPEEACALRWEHISSDCTEMLISEALRVDMREAQETKNGKITRFPCNSRLQRLLRLQKSGFSERSSYVLPARNFGRFDYHNFQGKYWRPLVEDLRDRGLVAFYLSQYHARHTFITEGLKANISVPDMAYLVRTSPAVLYRHYVDRTRAITVPEF